MKRKVGSFIIVILLWSTVTAAAERVEITFWFGHPESNLFAQALAQKIEEFNQINDLGIHVNVVFTGGGGGAYLDRIITAQAGGIGPDVAHMWTYHLQPLALQGLLLDVYEVIEPSRVRQLADLTPGALEMVSYDGALYGLPVSANTFGLIYNGDNFAEAGLAGAPATVQELDQYAQRLTRLNSDGSIAHMGYYPDDFTRLYWGWVFGGDYYDAEAQQYTIDDPRIVEALEWVVSYGERYGLDAINIFRAQLGSPAQGQGPLISGRFSILSIGQYRIPTLRRLAPDVDWRFAPLPTAPGGPQQPTTLIEADVVAVLSTTPHPKEAAEFLLWFGSSATLATMIQEHNLLIPHRGVSPGLYHPDFQMWAELAQSPNARAVPFTPVSASFDRVFASAVAKAINGNMPASGALSEANEILNNLLREEIGRGAQ